MTTVGRLLLRKRRRRERNWGHLYDIVNHGQCLPICAVCPLSQRDDVAYGLGCGLYPHQGLIVQAAKRKLEELRLNRRVEKMLRPT